MKKINFSDRYGLTQAVLEGRKTMTRRVVSEKLWDRWTDYDDWCNTVAVSDVPKIRQCYEEKDFFLDNSPCKVGEVVAIAQSYRDVAQGGYPVDARYDAFRTENWGDGEDGTLKSSAGWNNKLFVRADLMPHHIRITDVKIERLQDISEADVCKEGFSFESINDGWGNSSSHWEYMLLYLDKIGRYKEIRSRNPQEAFSFLIDRISGKGTWESNPYVFVYEFELVD